MFGFLVNLPVVSYYEIGTALTANHAHVAMMGVYGMRAIRLALFCLRYLIPEQRWPDKFAKISFWSCNIGLAWMCFATRSSMGLSGMQMVACGVSADRRPARSAAVQVRRWIRAVRDPDPVEWLRAGRAVAGPARS